MFTTTLSSGGSTTGDKGEGSVMQYDRRQGGRLGDAI